MWPVVGVQRAIEVEGLVSEPATSDALTMSFPASIPAYRHEATSFLLRASSRSSGSTVSPVAIVRRWAITRFDFDKLVHDLVGPFGTQGQGLSAHLGEPYPASPTAGPPGPGSHDQ